METQFRVRYYETDAMGIVHHSNYIRWFELARTEFLRFVGLPYNEMERDGIQAQVLGVTARYRKPARYDDLIRVETLLDAYTPTRAWFAYRVFRGNDCLCEGKTEHAFVMNGRPVALSRSAPAYHAAFQAMMSGKNE